MIVFFRNIIWGKGISLFLIHELENSSANLNIIKLLG